MKTSLAAILLAAVLFHGLPSEAETPDSSSVASLADSLFRYWIEDAPTPIPGGVVVVANAGGILFSRGYGMADIEREEPFDPVLTVVRLASVTKIFTAMAVAQLAVGGAVDLDEPAENHLAGLRIHSPTGVDVTPRHLLTHTAGFDESMIGLKSRHARDIPPLADFLAGCIPPVVREPGTAFCYSGIGVSIAARIVETVSGEPYEAYVRERILDPLGMGDTGFETNEFPGKLLMGQYEYSSDDAARFVRVEKDFVNIRGSAGMRSTAADMGRFIGMMLGEATVPAGTAGAGIVPDGIAPGVVDLMLTPNVVSCPGLPRSMGLAWHLERRGETVVAYHAGGNRGAGCFVCVAPSLDVGFFVAWNHDAGGGLQRSFADAFLDRFVGPVCLPEPETPASIAAQGSSAPDPRRLAGSWRYLPHSQETVEKFARFPDGGLAIAAGTGDTLLVGGRVFTKRGAGIFVHPPTGESLCFFGGDTGRPAYVSWNGLHTFRRLPWYEEPSFTVPFLVVCVSLLVSILVRPVAESVMRLAGRGTGPAGLEKSAGETTAAMLLVFLPLARAGARSAGLVFGPSPAFAAVMAIPILALLPASLFAWRVVDAWRSGRGSLAGRIHQSVVFAGILGCYWIFHAQRLLGWRW
ncbi:MAG: beta-lactamase family protein [Candidatus Krumholzibacteriota bacterium]|nr:beta-lactamase family protein [Candidatus Krumholzibacteriota bacterium]